MIDEEYEKPVNLRPSHREQLRHCLQLELENRLSKLQFNNVIAFQQFYERAIRAIDGNRVNTNILVWCWEQFVTYGKTSGKPYISDLKKWLPLAIDAPELYEHLDKFDKEHSFTLPVKPNHFDDELKWFLFSAQCFSEFYDLDFSFVFTQYTCNKTHLKMFEWLRLHSLFGTTTKRKALAEMANVSLKVIPTMPKAYSVHLESMYKKVDLMESYSALEIVSRIHRHKLALLTTTNNLLNKKMWYDGDELIFNPFDDEEIVQLSRLIDNTIENGFRCTRAEAQLINKTVKAVGLADRVLYPW
jgi:hypothetical protein